MSSALADNPNKVAFGTTAYQICQELFLQLTLWVELMETTPFVPAELP